MSKQKEPRGLAAAFSRGLAAVRRALAAYNRRLSKVYSPRLAALTGTGLVLLLLALTLFVPPYVGVADDGSLSDILLGTGLGYRRQDLTAPTGAYMIRLYLHSTYQPGGFSTHRVLIRFAMWLDDLFTHDNLFDVRFLAGVYALLYLPGVYLVLRGIAARVKVAAEATFLVVLGALILGDAATVSYFNSLYPEALWIVGVIYVMGFCMEMQYGTPGRTHLGLWGLLAAGGVLILTESHCAAVGLALTVFSVRQIMMEDKTAQTSALAGVCAVALLTLSVASAATAASRFTEASKQHAMTNGVLLRSENPEKTLAEFGIEPRFETLTDQSSYSDYPYALSGNPEIQRDFLARYDLGKIVLHYVRHPLSFIGLLEVSVQAAFQPLRSYVGSFEAAAGRPERSVNQAWTYYSNFKANSMPRTLGFLLILLGVYWALFRRRRGAQHYVVNWTYRERQIMLDTFLLLLGMGLAHLAAVLCLSGTAEIERYKTLCGVCVDGMVLLFAAEILHRLNILSSEE